MSYNKITRVRDVLKQKHDVDDIIFVEIDRVDGIDGVYGRIAEDYDVERDYWEVDSTKIVTGEHILDEDNYYHYYYEDIVESGKNYLLVALCKVTTLEDEDDLEKVSHKAGIGKTKNGHEKFDSYSSYCIGCLEKGIDVYEFYNDSKSDWGTFECVTLDLFKQYCDEGVQYYLDANQIDEDEIDDDVLAEIPDYEQLYKDVVAKVKSYGYSEPVIFLYDSPLMRSDVDVNSFEFSERYVLSIDDDSTCYEVVDVL